MRQLLLTCAFVCMCVCVYVCMCGRFGDVCLRLHSVTCSDGGTSASKAAARKAHNAATTVHRQLIQAQAKAKQNYHECRVTQRALATQFARATAKSLLAHRAVPFFLTFRILVPCDRGVGFL